MGLLRGEEVDELESSEPMLSQNLPLLTTPRRIGRQRDYGEADTGINRFNTAHTSNIEGELSGPNTAEASEIN